MHRRVGGSIPCQGHVRGLGVPSQPQVSFACHWLSLFPGGATERKTQSSHSLVHVLGLLQAASRARSLPPPSVRVVLAGLLL